MYVLSFSHATPPNSSKFSVQLCLKIPNVREVYFSSLKIFIFTLYTSIWFYMIINIITVLFSTVISFFPLVFPLFSLVQKSGHGLARPLLSVSQAEIKGLWGLPCHAMLRSPSKLIWFMSHGCRTHGDQLLQGQQHRVSAALTP